LEKHYLKGVDVTGGDPTETPRVPNEKQTPHYRFVSLKEASGKVCASDTISANSDAYSDCGRGGSYDHLYFTLSSLKT